MKGCVFGGGQRLLKILAKSHAKMWSVDGSNGGHLQMLAKEMTDKDAENAALEVRMSACCTYTAYLWILQHAALPHSGRRQIWRD